LQSRPKAAARLTRNSPLFKNIITGIKEKKGGNIVSLDLKKIDEAVADFFILCEADSHAQVKAIADNVQAIVEENVGEQAWHRESGDLWTLVDYVNIVVHIFQKDHRRFYDLENLWADAPRMDHPDEPTKP